MRYLDGVKQVVDKEECAQEFGRFSHVLSDDVTMTMDHVLRKLYLHLQILADNTSRDVNITLFSYSLKNLKAVAVQ